MTDTITLSDGDQRRAIDTLRAAAATRLAWADVGPDTHTRVVDDEIARWLPTDHDPDNLLRHVAALVLVASDTLATLARTIDELEPGLGPDVALQMVFDHAGAHLAPGPLPPPP